MNKNNNPLNELLFLSLKQFIDCKKYEKCRTSENEIHFESIYKKGYKVSKLKDKLPLSYNNAIHLIYYLNLQQEFLERNGHGFFLLAIENIIIIERGIQNYT
jgi:hypothetical protein